MKFDDPKLVRITVDDLGLYRGIEQGVVALSTYGVPIYCSWLTNYFPPSEEYLAKSVLKSGLHFNLIEGISHSKSPLLSDTNGKFSRGWASFIFADKQVRLAVEEELELQIQQALQWFGSLSHIDSHLHIHSIPWIFKLLQRKQKEYGIEFLRNPYQPIADDWSIFVKPVSLAKVILLRIFSVLNRTNGLPCYGISYLFSMQHEKVLSIAQKRSREILWHPGIAEKNISFENYFSLSEAELDMRESELKELTEFVKKISCPISN